MKPSRRELLSGMSAIALAPGCSKPKRNIAASDSGTTDTGTPAAAPAPERSSEPDTSWEPEGFIDEDRFPSGIQVGDVGPNSAIVSIWMTTDEAVLRQAEAVGAEWIEAREPTVVVRDGNRARIELTGLAADTPYCIFASDSEGRSRVTRFRTALGSDGWRQLTIGATACLKRNQPWANMSHVAATRPDLFMLLGDTVYADHANTLEEYQAYWAAALTTQGLKDVSALTSLIATWDDHEVMDSFEGLNTPIERHEMALEAFREGIPQREGEDGGIWRKLSWGKTADIFVLDSRGERDGESQYLSPAQMDWLKQGLRDSTARFKLIMNSVPITDYTPIFGAALESDRWQGYPAQRGELLDHIVANETEGVLWITGDFHCCTASRVDPEGGVAADQWEIMVGPGGSNLNIVADLVEPSTQFPLMFGAWASNLIHLDPGTGQVRVQWVGDDGEVIEQFEIQL
jgi:alkaline phosphatase D